MFTGDLYPVINIWLLRPDPDQVSPEKNLSEMRRLDSDPSVHTGFGFGYSDQIQLQLLLANPNQGVLTRSRHRVQLYLEVGLERGKMTGGLSDWFIAVSTSSVNRPPTPDRPKTGFLMKIIV